MRSPKALRGSGRSPVYQDSSRGGPTSHKGLAWFYSRLRSTGRGKHVGPYSYYHVSLADRCPEFNPFLTAICDRLRLASTSYNVVKLDRRSRISFLDYGDFTVPFPVLEATVACELVSGTTRRIAYSADGNPPILHRKELLLAADDPLAQAGARLTACLEARGAFVDSHLIGTRAGWNRSLAKLGIGSLIQPQGTDAQD